MTFKIRQLFEHHDVIHVVTDNGRVFHKVDGKWREWNLSQEILKDIEIKSKDEDFTIKL